MIKDLKNIFDKFDKFTKSDTFLHDLKFGMAISNLKKTFDEFLVWFILAIASLDFTDQHKISNLCWTFCEQLWFKMADDIIYTLFS